MARPFDECVRNELKILSSLVNDHIRGLHVDSTEKVMNIMESILKQCGNLVERYPKLIELMAIVVKLQSREASVEIEAMKWLEESLDIETCVLLIDMWMMALVAKDLSAIVTFARVKVVDKSADSSHDTKLTVNQQVVEVVQTQGRNDAGLVRLFLPVVPEPIYLAYELNITDVGPKDLHKLISKESVEDEICAAVSTILQHTAND
jgi:uncharacterized protein YsxB (DUF464 family)